MEDYYCLDISFPGIEFDSFILGSEPSKTFHHAHLYSKENEIELRILFVSNTNFGRKFLFWVSKINWRKFGSFIKVSNENQNDRILKIDFTLASLLGVTSSTKQYEENLQYVSIRMDLVKIYWIPSKENLNTAEFYFNDAGFKVVKDYYSPLMGLDGNFKFSRMNDREAFYPIGKAEFRPEFDFYYGDDIRNRKATITKEPKLHFSYKEKISEEEAIKYAELICLLASFYFHTKIDFILGRIHLSDYTITIKKVQKKIYNETSGGLWGFKNNWDFHKFLKSNWQTQAFKEIKKLSKAIELFIQSNIVDQNSKFLIRYNVIEICMGGKKQTDKKFLQILSDKDKKSEYDKALTILLNTIKLEEQSLFKKKWFVISKKLDYKPMDSPLMSFLIKQKIPVSLLPISIKRLKEIRDCLTHGSIDRIQDEELEKANVLLYRISGILILNLLGIGEWEFDTNLK